ncbi:hypothetical protein CO2235_230344 [Cupriavidus oxalaticus]|uniref:Uncharacterized protein n=1 Tax=Cupriavidus oxalaticus TaxID=96344 RepID=A0A976GAL4_9BURK|nr:hypothetical protein CO2235_230344 [Cupriavidus oxalaticus]
MPCCWRGIVPQPRATWCCRCAGCRRNCRNWPTCTASTACWAWLTAPSRFPARATTTDIDPASPGAANASERDAPATAWCGRRALRVDPAGVKRDPPRIPYNSGLFALPPPDSGACQAGPGYPGTQLFPFSGGRPKKAGHATNNRP